MTFRAVVVLTIPEVQISKAQRQERAKAKDQARTETVVFEHRDNRRAHRRVNYETS